MKKKGKESLEKIKVQKKKLLKDDDPFIYMNFTFSKVPDFYSIRPIPITVPHSLNISKVCLIVKDPKSEFKELGLKFDFLFKVIDISKLKLKFSRFKEKRDLINNYDLFICDQRVYFVLSKLLGKPFYKSKKYPIPISLDSNKEKTYQTISDLVQKRTIFYQNHGPNYSIKVAKMHMSESSIFDNALTVAVHTLPHILKWGIEFNDLKSITLKTTDSIDFPFYHHLSIEEIMTYLDKN